MKKVLLILNDNPIDPLGPMYLISNTENVEFTVVFVSKDTKNLEHIKLRKYDIAGFSTITGSHQYHNKIATYLKDRNKNLVTIMGGPHPTFFPIECAKELRSIDFICRGEGVLAFNKWINGHPTNNILSTRRLRQTELVGGLDELCNINEIKVPDRKKVYGVGHRIDNEIRNFMGIQGCPYDCSYCFNKSLAHMYKGQPRIRYKDVNAYHDEITDVCSRYKTKILYFQEDTFIIKKDWFFNLTDKLNVPYHCHIRCDLMSDEITKQLSKTGCRSVTFAIENGNYNYRKSLLNRKMTDEQILNTAHWLHKYNIKFRIENMVGLPASDINDDMSTLKLNAMCKPTIGWASIFQPFPNTQLGNVAKQTGEWDGNIDNINAGFFDGSPLKLSNKKERERLQKIFSFACEYKVLNILSPLLVRLPLDGFYKIMYQKFKDRKYRELYG